LLPIGNFAKKKRSVGIVLRQDVWWHGLSLPKQ